MQLKSSVGTPADRRQILDLLSLKQDILDYEHETEYISHVPQLRSLLPSTINYAPRTIKHHRRPKAKTHHPQNTNNPRNTHSQRMLRRREMINDNKVRLKSRMIRNDTEPPKYHQPEQRSSHKKGFVSLHANRPQSAIQKGHHYRSLLTKPQVKQERQLIESMPEHQTRLKGFKDKYKSACRMEKTRPTLADKQHQEIENIVEAIKAQKTKGQQTPLATQQREPENKGQEQKLKPSVGGVRRYQRKARMGRSLLKQSIKVGKILKERYKMLEKIGEGLSGQVWKGQDVLAGRQVAVKVIGAGDRTHKEHDFYKRVQHKGLVTYYNSFTEGTSRYLILEYFPLTLNAHMRTHSIPTDEVKSIFKSLATTLHFLHGMAIAHRDIKLENIVVSQDLQQVKFIDFGLCIDLNTSSSRLSRQFCGTVHYMPPEILERRPYAPKKADVWSLGVLLYRLLLDRFPFRGKDEREMSLKIHRTKLVFAEWMEPQLQSLLRGMLRREPEGRWDMGQVIEHPWLH